jgi:hypothetical protein
LRYFCSPHHQDSALFPFIDQLDRAAGFERDNTPSVRLEKIEALVAANAPAEGDVQLLAEMLSVPLDGCYPALDLSPQRKKERTFEALLRQLSGGATRQLVLMIFEDLHWADPSSRELLDLTVEQIPRLPVLLIATFRPEFQSPWIGLPQVTALSLRRLARDESDQLVRGLVRHTVGLSRQVIDEIVDRTDGVPLFLEELTKAVLENAVISSIPAVSLAVPATLHASYGDRKLARLRLDPSWEPRDRRAGASAHRRGGSTRSGGSHCGAPGPAPRHGLKAADAIFARHLQASPSKAARTARVQRAKRLLDETSLPMTEIAMRAGFGSLRRFNSVFAETYGRPPTEIRRTLRSADKAE